MYSDARKFESSKLLTFGDCNTDGDEYAVIVCDGQQIRDQL